MMRTFFILLFTALGIGLYSTSYHTISIDGTNDFASDEDLPGTSGTIWYFTWDANNFYFGCMNDNVDDNSSTKWVHLYIDATPTTPSNSGAGTSTGITYNTQQPNLPFNADYHFRWKTDNTFTNLQAYASGSWGNGNNSGILAFQSGQFVEFRIPRANLGNPSALYVAGAMINEQGGFESTYYMTPSGNTPGYDANYTQWFGFSLTSGVSPDASGNLNALFPVELLDFTAKAKEGSTLLTWQTATEQDNSHFDIERSTDSRTWKTIGSVQGRGTTNFAHHYSFTDHQPLPGINYYRLKQTDFDGAFEYSKVLSIDFENFGPTIRFFPNPVGEELTIGMPSDLENLSGTAKFYDAGGRQVLSSRLSGSTLQVSDLMPGLYLVKVVSENNQVLAISRLVKK